MANSTFSCPHPFLLESDYPNDGCKWTTERDTLPATAADAALQSWKGDYANRLAISNVACLAP